MSESRKLPPTPKKAPYKGIPPSSEYYTENNNLTNENIENVKVLSEQSMETMIKETKGSPGNRNPNYSKSILNYKPKVPKMKLPLHLQGGKRTRRRSRTRKYKGTRRH